MAGSTFITHRAFLDFKKKNGGVNVIFL